MDSVAEIVLLKSKGVQKEGWLKSHSLNEGFGRSCGLEATPARHQRASVSFCLRVLACVFLLAAWGCGAKRGNDEPMTTEAGNPLVQNGRWSEMHQAVDEGNRTKLQSMLSKGLSPEVAAVKKEDRWLRPLHLAAQKGDVMVAQVLVEAGADVNSEMSTGETPLHTAVKAGHRAMVVFLLSKGADRDKESFYIHKPMKLAEELGRQDLVDALKAD